MRCFAVGGLFEPVSAHPGEDCHPGVQVGSCVPPDQDRSLLHGPRSHQQESGEGSDVSRSKQWIVPQIFKLLPKRHIFFDLVIRFITNCKYAFF